MVRPRGTYSHPIQPAYLLTGGRAAAGVSAHCWAWICTRDKGGKGHHKPHIRSDPPNVTLQNVEDKGPVDFAVRVGLVPPGHAGKLHMSNVVSHLQHGAAQLPVRHLGMEEVLARAGHAAEGGQPGMQLRTGNLPGSRGEWHDGPHASNARIGI